MGVSRQVATCNLALKRGFVDRASTDLASLKDTEIISICTFGVSFMFSELRVRALIVFMLFAGFRHKS